MTVVSAFAALLGRYGRLCCYGLSRSFIAFLCLGIYACGDGKVSGGEQTVFESSIDITGATLRVNNVTGSDTADGLNEPFQTLQHALNELRPGDVLVIEDTDTPYSSNAVIAEQRDQNDMLVRSLRGFVVETSGTEALPIVIEGRGANSPVIDQSQSTSTPTDAVLGLLLNCASFITVKNLEIRNVNEAGISSAVDGSCETRGITLENNHIHHVYGEKMVGGVRMMGVSNLSVQGNRIHDIFSNQSSEETLLLRRAKGISDIVIENNDIQNVGVGLQLNAQGITRSGVASVAQEIIDLRVANNVFSQLDNAIALNAQIADAIESDEVTTGVFAEANVYGNTFEEIDTALSAELGAGQHQSELLCFFNNTAVNTQAEAIGLTGVEALQIFNNIFALPQAEIVVTSLPQNAGLVNALDYVDHNRFWNLASPSWRLNVDGGDEMDYPDLVSWNNAMHPELATFPGLESRVEDPEFVDFSAGDYRLSGTSPLLGAGHLGLSIGADFTLPNPSASLFGLCSR